MGKIYIFIVREREEQFKTLERKKTIYKKKNVHKVGNYCAAMKRRMKAQKS